MREEEVGKKEGSGKKENGYFEVGDDSNAVKVHTGEGKE